jgi:hypothetical protein
MKQFCLPMLLLLLLLLLLQASPTRQTHMTAMMAPVSCSAQYSEALQRRSHSWREPAPGEHLRQCAHDNFITRIY